MKTLHILTLITTMSITALADTALKPAKESTQATMLLARACQPVELRLKSGEKISGKVESVGEHLVHLTTLTGMEMYEATISLQDISAVVVRSPAK